MTTTAITSATDHAIETLDPLPTDPDGKRRIVASGHLFVRLDPQVREPLPRHRHARQAHQDRRKQVT